MFFLSFRMRCKAIYFTHKKIETHVDLSKGVQNKTFVIFYSSYDCFCYNYEHEKLKSKTIVNQEKSAWLVHNIS